MRIASAVGLLAVVATGCVGEDAVGTSTESSRLTQRNTSITWIANETCGGLFPCDGNAIWPPGLGITDVEILTRAGPDRLNHTQQTFLAFVVWNKTTVGQIFRIDPGVNGADFRAKASNVVATRTFNLEGTQGGNVGTAIGGPPPVPHPSVDGDLTFTDPYLGAVKASAAAISEATHNFLVTPENIPPPKGTISVP